MAVELEGLAADEMVEMKGRGRAVWKGRGWVGQKARA
jgi:hypothetical protein